MGREDEEAGDGADGAAALGEAASSCFVGCPVRAMKTESMLGRSTETVLGDRPASRRATSTSVATEASLSGACRWVPWSTVAGA